MFQELTIITGNNGAANNNGTVVPKVNENLPRSGESNFKVVIGIFVISILGGIMYIYQNKLRRITRRSRRK